MDLTSPNNIKKIIKPTKSLGQNFLIDEAVIDDLIDIADLKKKDNVLEIGPGLGAITKKLNERANKVLAIEKDRHLIEHLRNLKLQNVEVINTDFLQLNLTDLDKNDYKVVANLPFNVATAIIRKILTEGEVDSIVVIIQKEVAQKIESKGDKESFLSVITKINGNPEVCKTVSRSSFWPAPRVDGAILKIIPHDKYKDTPYDEMFKIIEAGFKHSRKQLKNNLKNFSNLSKKEAVNLLKSTGLNTKIRAEDLEVSDWKILTDKYLTLVKKENKIN